MTRAGGGVGWWPPPSCNWVKMWIRMNTTCPQFMERVECRYFNQLNDECIMSEAKHMFAFSIVVNAHYSGHSTLFQLSSFFRSPLFPLSLYFTLSIVEWHRLWWKWHISSDNKKKTKMAQNETRQSTKKRTRKGSNILVGCVVSLLLFFCLSFSHLFIIVLVFVADIHSKFIRPSHMT